jgi:O-antigen/teichoic acid export membrane protein
MTNSSFRSKLTVFVSGRAIALPTWLLFQIVIVRLLVPQEYAVAAFAIGAAGFIQALTMVGIPQIFSRYLPEALLTGRYAVARKIVIAGLVFHVVLAIVTILLAMTVWRLLAPGSITNHVELLFLVPVFVIATIIYADADNAAQNFMLQRLSRWVAIAEPVVKLGFLVIVALLGRSVTAADILVISIATTGGGTIVLLTGVRKFISRKDGANTEPWPRYRELCAIGLASYLSTLAWLTMNAAMVRLIAASQLDVTSFAGFAFLQSLTTLVQRFSPGFILAPFIQPAIIGRYTENKDTCRLGSALSIMSKIDMVVIGACIVGIDIAGEAAISVLTGGRYADQASITQWFLLLLILNGCYRCYEIASVALGVTSGMMRTLIVGIVSLGTMILLGRFFGIWALLVVPVADALVKLWVVGRPIRLAGLVHVVEWQQFLEAAVVALVLIVAGRWAVHAIGAEAPWLAITIGVALSLTFLAVVAALRPLRQAEAALLAHWDTWPYASLVKRLSRLVN